MECRYTLAGSEAENRRLSLQAKELYGGTQIMAPYLAGASDILDVGCGTGFLTAWVAETHPTSCVVGVDSDGERLQTIRSTLPNLTLKNADAHSLPFPDSQFDVTLCRFMLMHVTDPLAIIKEMVRVTKPGGKVIAHEGIQEGIWLSPALPFFCKLVDQWNTIMKEKGQDPSTGLRLFELFTKCGLRDIKSETLSHGVDSTSSLFRMYLDNWIEISSSLEKTLSNRITSSELTELRNQLENFSPPGYYLELTNIAVGHKI